MLTRRKCHALESARNSRLFFYFAKNIYTVSPNVYRGIITILLYFDFSIDNHIAK